MSDISHIALIPFILNIPEGYSESLYQGEKFGVTRHTYNQGKSFKIFAHSLSGNNFISLNYYQLKAKNLLKPCEMPASKVIDFLIHHQQV